jgi:glycosyltransferase involved in cell wall biosynthesis
MADPDDLGAEPLRVSLVVATTEGGMGRYVRSLTAGLVQRGVRVHVIGPRSTEERFDFSGAGAAFAAWEVGDRPRPASDVVATLRLRRLLRGTDVVHAHGVRSGALVALALTGRRRPRLVVTLHNAPVTGGRIGATYTFLERVVARRADLVYGVSGDLVERARRRGARAVERAVVAAPPLPSPRRDRAAIRAELGAGERPLVLAVGRLADQKGFPTLLDASTLWARRSPPPLVVIAGEGPLEQELARRIDADGLPVRLLGRRGDVSDLLAATDVLVVPSLWEGQSLLLQEALRSGRPIVATAVGGTPDVVGDAALLVPPGDAPALSRAVGSIIDDGELAARLARAARDRAAALPTEGEAVEEVLLSYRRLGRSRPS